MGRPMRLELTRVGLLVQLARVGGQMKDVCLKPTVKHGGGSITVWGCLTTNGMGDLIRIDGIMNVEKYKQILFSIQSHLSSFSLVMVSFSSRITIPSTLLFLL